MSYLPGTAFLDIQQLVEYFLVQFSLFNSPCF